MKIEDYASETEPVEPYPLTAEIPPAEPYPVDSMGDILGPAVLAIHETVKAPLAMCCQSVLAGATVAAQSVANIDIDGRLIPLSNFFITLGETGERKTGVDGPATWAHHKFQKEKAQEYDEQFSQYELEFEAWKAAKDSAKKVKPEKGGSKKEAILKAMEEVGQEPMPPMKPIFLSEEPTLEGLIKQADGGIPSIGLFSDEGGRLLGGHAMNSENKLKTITGLSKFWGGSPIDRVRSGDKSMILYNRRLSMHLMIQPQIGLTNLLGDELAREQGITGRCLICFPETTCGTRTYIEKNVFEDWRLKLYQTKVLEFLGSMQTNEKSGGLILRSISLDFAAKELWISFHNQVEAELAPNKEFLGIRGFAAKSAEHCLRLAGVLAVFDDPSCERVELGHIEKAIGLVQFYLSEALRLKDAARVSPELEDCKRLLKWIKQKGYRFISLPDIYQQSFTRARKKADASRLVGILADHGYLQRIDDEDLPKLINGNMRREGWEVVHAV